LANIVKFLKVSHNYFKTSLTISELRAGIAKAVKSARKSPIAISKHGKEIAVLMSKSMYETILDQLEELDDIEAYDAAKARKEESAAWSDARKDLGLV
jgi:prevent-host-death family protein